MKKKTLKSKIIRACLWTALFTVVYFIGGAYLKSDGLKFDPNKTYDLIKDTLTLTAAFLAPIAAFVLFSDWRDEHRVKTILGTIESIIQKLSEIERTLLRYRVEIDNKKISLDDTVLTIKALEHYDTVLDLELILSIKYLEISSDEQCVINFRNEFKEHLNKIRALRAKYKELETVSDLIKQYLNQNQRNNEENQIDFSEFQTNFDNLSLEISKTVKKLADKLNELLRLYGIIKEEL